MSRVDHCFLMAGAAGERAIVFCRADGFEREAARREVTDALQSRKRTDGYHLAYLGLLDYREMEAPVESMLEPFEKLGPVWLAFFRWPEEPEVQE